MLVAGVLLENVRLESALCLPLFVHLILFLVLILLLVQTLANPTGDDQAGLLLTDEDDWARCFLPNVLVFLRPLTIHFTV